MQVISRLSQQRPAYKLPNKLSDKSSLYSSGIFHSVTSAAGMRVSLDSVWTPPAARYHYRLSTITSSG
jgi:hypothetical protein